MIWLTRTHHTGSLAYSCDLGRIGWLEIVPDEVGWTLLWSNFGVETELGDFATAEAAKVGASAWVEVVRTELANVQAQGFNQVDEE